VAWFGFSIFYSSIMLLKLSICDCGTPI